MSGSALEVDVPLIDGHFPVVPGLGTLSAGSPSAADTEVLVGQTHGSTDLDVLGLGVADQLVGHLLDGVQLVAAEGDPGALDVLVLNTLLLVLVSHIY